MAESQACSDEDLARQVQEGDTQAMEALVERYLDPLLGYLYRLLYGDRPLARMALVFGFDTLLGVAASLVITALEPALLLWPFVLSWLAPMALLSSLAFLISVIWRDSVAGILASMSLWCGYHIWRMASAGFKFTGGHELVTAAPYLMLATMLLSGLALWLVEHRESGLRITNHVD